MMPAKINGVLALLFIVSAQAQDQADYPGVRWCQLSHERDLPNSKTCFYRCEDGTVSFITAQQQFICPIGIYKAQHR